ncbi:MAG: CCA tRNA nucleotidyltransferase [Firmicutes bacterium]|nr:CCA tRNA nucleotidyltransferase [Bacillota bacterium]
MLVLPEPIKKALQMLEKAGYEGYIVGGCVRDFLMGKSPDDYDVTTSALPKEVEAIFAEHKVIETGLKHGTVTVIIDGLPLEITTFRVEGEYLDGRRPSEVSFTRSLREDVARRDFTMNAMAMDLRGKLYDYYGGQDDIDKGIIRCVGNPAERFDEDALRIMRAIRFASQTGFILEDKTKKAALEHKENLLKISAERIRIELLKLLCGKDVKNVLIEYVDILSVFMPEIKPTVDFDQKTHWHIYDVFTHTAVAVASIEAKAHLRMAALLHDIGKPSSFSVDENGSGHFYGHALVSVDLARDILNRLKFDNDTKDKILKLVKYHDVPIEPTVRSVKRALNKYTKEGFFDLVLLKRADNMAQNPELAIRQEYLDQVVAVAEDIIAESQCFSLKDLAVNGRDLIEAGHRPGKELGHVLDQLLEQVLEDKLPNDKAKLLEFAQKIKK